MERNFVKEIINILSSGKCRRVRRWALCSLSAAAVLGLAFALIMSAVTVEPGAREVAVQELEEIDGSCQIEADGFITTLHVKGNENLGLADIAGEKQLLFASVGDTVIPSSVLPEEIDKETEGEVVSKVEYHVEEVMEGEEYDALVSQLAGNGNELMPVQVMKVTAIQDGKELDLSGCKITVQAEPAEELIEAASTKLGTTVTVLPLGGEAVEQSFTNAEVNSGNMSPVTATYTVPEGEPVMYAVMSESDNDKILTGNEKIGQIRVTEEMTIDLNGYSIEPSDPDSIHRHEDSCYKDPKNDDWTLTCEWKADDIVGLFFVEGGTLTIRDSSSQKSGKIIVSNKESLIVVKDGGKLNIEGGELQNLGGQRVITALGTGTVDMSGGIVTGATEGIWGGAGIFADAGDVNISGGSIRNNKAGNGGGIYATSGKVSISGGEIDGNTAVVYGGGIFATNIDISGGEIKKNSAQIGGGIYGNGKGKVTIFEGTISDNKASSDWAGGGGIGTLYGEVIINGGKIEGNTAEKKGGGIYAGKDNLGKSDTNIIMSGGEILRNTAKQSGGGVWTYNMKMTGGTIANNTAGVNGSAESLGGGGIFIEQNDKDVNYYTFKGSDSDKNCNLHLTGGSISHNISYHTGGGIFVNRGAVAYINGENGIVHIDSNEAKDQFFTKNNKDLQHGYAGGGIFVEHLNASTAEEGGHVYLYNALITNNEALYGGGVAGCSISKVNICSVNGVAVYGNKLRNDNRDAYTTDDYNLDQYAKSDDIFVVGNGLVDPMILGGVSARWVGTKSFKTGDIVQLFSEGGFYLKATLDNPADDATVRKYATVFIENNKSESGGGGVGGNGVMMLGLKEAEREPCSLELEKIVSGMEDSTGSQISPTFKFKITLTDINRKPLKSISFENVKQSESSGSSGTPPSTSTTQSKTSNDGIYEFDLGNRGYIKILELPVGTLYTIEEVPTNEYYPSFEVIKGDVENDNSQKNKVIGWIVQDNSIVFTNTALYALPSTGGQTTTMYYLLGCALLATTLVGGWIYKRHSKSA